MMTGEELVNLVVLSRPWAMELGCPLFSSLVFSCAILRDVECSEAFLLS